MSQDEPQATRTHKIHHDPNLGKPSLSPLWYTLYLFTRCTSKQHFVPGFLSGSPEIPKIGTPTTLGPHYFVCRPLIIIRSEAKLYPSLGAFQQHVTRHLNTRKSNRSLTFSGWESNRQFDSRPFFRP
jgi:hypothetical protein